MRKPKWLGRAADAALAPLAGLVGFIIILMTIVALGKEMNPPNKKDDP